MTVIILFGITQRIIQSNDEDFDVVSACMFELEKRIWAGIVDSDNTRLQILVDTWYDKNKVDNYTEQLYADWSAKEKVSLQYSKLLQC